MRYYAVLDTNVLVSALIRWKSLPGAVAMESLIGHITPLLNEDRCGVPGSAAPAKVSIPR